MSIPVHGQIAEQLRKSTVQTCCRPHSSSGSGFVISPELVMTNAHVLSAAPLVVDSWEGKSSPGKLLRMDIRRDVALVEVTGLQSPPVSLVDSNDLKPGAPVFAVGNPLGFVGAVSSGVIHSGTFFLQQGAQSLNWICADLRLAPGNSGGPLANFRGQVLGMNTMIASSGIALAVPSEALKRFLEGKPERSSLGVVLRPVECKDRGMGLLILNVTQNGGADLASLLPGDILISSNGQRFKSPGDLQRKLLEAKDGTLSLEFYRGTQTSLRKVTAVLSPEQGQNAA